MQLLRPALLTAIVAFVATFSPFKGAEAAPPSYLVTVNDTQGDTRSDTQWARAQCIFLSNVTTLARRAAADVTCARDVPPNNGRYFYHFHSERQADGARRLRVENWARADETDFEVADWRVAPGTEADQKLQEQKLLEKFFDYDRNKRVVRELALLNGITESKNVRLDKASGEYHDARSGLKLDFAAAWKLYQGESPRLRDYLRATIEMAVVLGSGTAWYWGNGDLNRPDWEYQFDWASFRKKLLPPFDGVRFDTNFHYTNALWHPFTGALFYLFARTNRLSVLESFLFTFAASSIWEYLVEYREKVSLNDVIVTPVAGMVIGECFAQLGAFFERGSDSIVNRVLSAIFSGPRALHNWMDSNHIRKRPGHVDGMGFTRDIWHQFDIWTGAALTEVSGTAGNSSRHDLQIGLETQLINVPGYGQPGETSRMLSDGNFSQLIAKATFGEKGVLDFLFFAKAAMAGYFKQSIERGESGALRGYSFFIGAASAFEYNSHAQAGTTDDKLGVVNVLGPTVDLSVYIGGVRIHAVLDVFGDFAMVRSYAVDSYLKDNPAYGIKSILAKQRYYYAIGVTSNARINAQWKSLELGGELKFDFFDSIEGLDRYQENIRNDFNLRDRRLGYRFWLAYTLPGDHLKLAFALERYFRQGEIGSTLVEREELRFLGNLLMQF